MGDSSFNVANFENCFNPRFNKGLLTTVKQSFRRINIPTDYSGNRIDLYNLLFSGDKCKVNIEFPTNSGDGVLPEEYNTFTFPKVISVVNLKNMVNYFRK
jgi:hypothetical protein